MNRTKQSPEPLPIEPLLLTIPQVCQYLNIKRATFYKINATGAFGLLPVKLGTCRKVLYRKTEIEKWIQGDCPHGKIWQSQRKEKKIMKAEIKKADASTPARNHKLHRKCYRNKLFPSSLKRNFSHQVQRHRHHHGWFSDLLILTSEQIRGKGNLKLANYYAQLATNNTDKSGGIVT